jgi:hypothetical protein
MILLSGGHVSHAPRKIGLFTQERLFLYKTTAIREKMVGCREWGGAEDDATLEKDVSLSQPD